MADEGITMGARGGQLARMRGLRRLVVITAALSLVLAAGPAAVAETSPSEGTAVAEEGETATESEETTSSSQRSATVDSNATSGGGDAQRSADADMSAPTEDAPTGDAPTQDVGTADTPGAASPAPTLAATTSPGPTGDADASSAGSETGGPAGADAPSGSAGSPDAYTGWTSAVVPGAEDAGSLATVDPDRGWVCLPNTILTGPICVQSRSSTVDAVQAADQHAAQDSTVAQTASSPDDAANSGSSDNQLSQVAGQLVTVEGNTMNGCQPGSGQGGILTGAICVQSNSADNDVSQRVGQQGTQDSQVEHEAASSGGASNDGPSSNTAGQLAGQSTVIEGDEMNDCSPGGAGVLTGGICVQANEEDNDIDQRADQQLDQTSRVSQAAAGSSDGGVSNEGPSSNEAGQVAGQSTVVEGDEMNDCAPSGGPSALLAGGICVQSNTRDSDVSQGISQRASQHSQVEQDAAGQVSPSDGEVVNDGPSSNRLLQAALQNAAFGGDEMKRCSPGDGSGLLMGGLCVQANDADDQADQHTDQQATQTSRTAQRARSGLAGPVPESAFSVDGS